MLEQLPPSPATENARGRGGRGQLAGAAALIAVFPAAYVLQPLILRDALPICPFRCATGKPCPLCGMTRAFATAMHGDFTAAFRFNPLWPVFAATFVTFAVLLVTDAAGRTHRAAAALGHALSHRWIWILLALCVFGAFRIITNR